MRRRRKDESNNIMEQFQNVPYRFGRMMRKKQWKRKAAAILTVAMLTGTFANGLTVTAPSGKAYAYASGSDALRDDILDEDEILSEDLPAKGRSSDYYLENAAEADLVISEEQIRKALEEEEPELDLGLFGYEDPRAVVGLYEEIQKAVSGYRLVDQGTLSEEELSYFIYIKEDAESDNLFESLYVIVVNPSEATDGDGRYNVYLKYDGQDYRLEAGTVQLKSLKALSREQLKEDELEDEPDVRIELDTGSGSGGSSGSGVSQDTVVTVEPDNFQNEETQGSEITDSEVKIDPEKEAAAGNSSNESAGSSIETEKSDAAESNADQSHFDQAEDGDKENAPEAADDADKTGSEAGEVSADHSSDSENTSDAISEADDDSVENNDEGFEHDADSAHDTDSQDSDTSSDSGSDSAEDAGTDSSSGDDAGEKLSMSAKVVSRVMAAVASFSNADVKDQIEELKKELKSLKQKAFSLEKSGSFEMSTLEMKIINQEEISDEDIELQAEEETTFVEKIVRKVALFGAAEEASENDVIETELLSNSSAMGLRANTIGMFQAAAVSNLDVKAAAGFTGVPEKLYYGTENNLLKNVAVEDENGAVIENIQISVENVTRILKSGAEDDSWSWDQNSILTVDREDAGSYEVTYHALKEADGIDFTKTCVIPVRRVILTVPAMEHLLYQNTYKLLPAEALAVDEEDDRIEYPIRVTAVTRKLVTGASGVDEWTWSGEDSITIERPDIESYTIVYEAYDEESKEAVSEPLTKVVSVFHKGGIGDTLDTAGDMAYLDAVYVDGSLRTGTAPFDAEAKDGNDTTAMDDILRTFDTTSYTVQLRSTVRPDSPYDHYENGTVCFEFILPTTSDKAIFDEGAMSWLQAKPYASYEIVQLDGKQVLRGSFLWTPNETNDSAIGESYMELNVAVRALAMKNGDTLKPVSTFWLGVNHVAEDNGSLQFDGDNGHAVGYDFPSGLVTDSGYGCPVHKADENREIEYKTVESPEVKITAAPRYNLRMSGDGSINTSRGEAGGFDFGTGKEGEVGAPGTAPNFDKSLIVKEGRVGSFGVVVQIQGKKGQGLRGVEMPDTTKPITFDLTVGSVFRKKDPNTNQTVTVGAVDDKYRPLLWSVEGNRSGSQSDGRKIVNVSASYARNTPLNKGGNRYSCYDGGSWGAWQEGNTIHVTVKDFELNFDPISTIPYNVPSAGTESKTFYDPDKVTNYWDIDTVCISAGEFWLLQPFTSIDGKDTNILEENGVSSGAFTLTVKDSRLQMNGESGAGLPEVNDSSNQSTTSDDAVYLAYDYLMPGSFDTIIKYTKFHGSWDQPLTEGCDTNGGDWATLGTNMSLQCYLSHDSKDGDYFGVAYDILLKFDNAMFQPDGSTSLSGMGTQKANSSLYGVVKGRETLGWDHKGLKPDQPGYDEHLINAGVDDLEFYTWADYKKLQDEQDYTCVAVLQEWRGLNTAQMVHNHLFVHGSVKLDPELGGNVYMISQAVRVWRKAEVKSLVQEKYGLSADTDPTDAQYDAFAKNDFPTQTKAAYNGHGYEAYPKPGHIDGPEDPMIKNFEKSSYYSDGTVKTMSSGNHFGDSCYIVGYKATLQKNVTQVTVDSTTEDSKLVYDLDNSQRAADYRIDPVIHRAQGILGSGTDAKFFVENLTITDTLPEGLTYIPGSAHLGGTYSMYVNGSGKRVEGVQGSVQGGELLEPEVSPDGRTLTWVIETDLYDPELSENDPDQKKGIWVNASGDTAVPSIYYSCDIGHIGADNDVIHNQQLENTATITAKGLTTKYSEEEGNKAKLSIQVSKMTSVSLSKTADQSAVEVGDPMHFTMKVGNNSNNAMDVIAYDTVPYNGDKNGSYFQNGECVLTEWRIDLDQAEGDAILKNGGFRFFYTEADGYADKSSSDFMENKTLKPELITESSDWNEVSITWDEENQCYKVNLPEGAKPTAVAAIGTLPGLTTLPMHTTVQLTDPKPGDCVSTTLSNKDMRSTARSFVLNRSLEGLVWYDFNYNGVQDSNEQKLNGIQVTLLREVNGRYQPYEGAQITTGHAYDIYTKETTEIETGRYQFNNLPAGTYAVEFSSGSSEGSDLSTYIITKKAVGNARFNSDADGISKNGLLKTAEITGNEMPEKEKIQTVNYTLSYLDAGLARPKGNLKFDKVDSVTKQQLADVDGDGTSDVEFCLTGEAFSINGVVDPIYEMSAKEFVNEVARNAAAFGIETTETPTSGKSSLTVKFKVKDGHVDFSTGDLGMILPRGKYTLTETKVPAGYTGAAAAEFEIYPDLSKESTRLADYTVGSSNPISNVPQEFTVLKVRDEDGSALEGAEFAVMKDGQKLQQITMENGVGVFYRSGLMANTRYTLEETKAPSGYQRIEPIAFMMKKADGQDNFILELVGTSEYAVVENGGVQIKVTNTPDTGSLTLTKALVGDQADIEAGKDKQFNFAIRLTPKAGYQLAESSVLQKDNSGNVTGIKAVKGETEHIVLPVQNGEVQVQGLKAEEYITISGLYYGTGYVITEDTSAETGYEFAGAAADGAEIQIDENKAQATGTIRQEQSDHSVVISNRIKTTDVTIGKTFDSDVPDVLPEFEIYDITGENAFVSADEDAGDRTLVGRIQITKINDSYSGTSEKVLKPGHEYQIVERLAEEKYPAYSPKVSERITVSVGQGNILVLSPAQITISNTRDKGWITVQKTLKTFDGEVISAKRDFYYKILKEDGTPLTLNNDGGVIGHIQNGDEKHSYFVNFGKYSVVEVREDGSEYQGADAEYLVENPDEVTVELRKPTNIYTFDTEIINKENALGELAIVKKANYAEKGQTFYFLVEDNKGHYITQAGERVSSESVGKTGVLWTIKAQADVEFGETASEIGQVKVGKKIPYGVYTVTETDENGEAVDAYNVSYQVQVGAEEKESNTGEIDIDDKSMTVTVTNSVKKGDLRIIKTFDSHVPEALPKFEIYQVGIDQRVAEVQIEKQADGTLSGEVGDLTPGYEYYAVEKLDPTDENSKLYEPITTESQKVVLGSDKDTIPTLVYNVKNERKNGYLEVSKKLFTHYDEPIYDAERVFYYVIKDSKGNKVEIAEEYRSKLSAHDENVAQITAGENDVNRHLLPLGKYTIEEVDESGKPYEKESFFHIFSKPNVNPMYEVINPDAVLLNPENWDGLDVSIRNTEKPLGKLTITKKADYAEKDDTFYFKVMDGRGQYVSKNGELKDEFSSGMLWTIKADENQPYAGDSSEVLLYEIGSVTAEKLPYGSYTVTETDADGKPLGDEFAYTVSYTVEVNGKSAGDGNTGELDYQHQEMTVTAVNKVNRTYLEITKTFNSHEPESGKLPVFAVYHVNDDDMITSAEEASKYVQVATASVALADPDADPKVYVGRTEKVLIPGYRYQAVEILNPKDVTSELYDPIVTDVLTATLEKDGAEIKPLTYTAENIRNYGYLYVNKELLNYYGEVLNDQRSFYYSIWDVKNQSYLNLPDMYLATASNMKVAKIQNGEEAHRIRVPYGQYRIDETDADGIPYEDEKPGSLLGGLFDTTGQRVKNPLYTVDAPDKITVDLGNADVAAATISNAEKPLGRLTVTKQTDWAEGGKTEFYFTVKNEKTGELIDAPVSGFGVVKNLFTKADAKKIWVIRAEETTDQLCQVGSLTAENLPYGTYVVTEVDQNGNPLPENYPYEVSYQVKVSGETENTEGEVQKENGTVTSDYETPNMDVTVTNTRSWGYLKIQKQLQDVHGNGFQDDTREFFYTVVNADGEAVALPEEYRAEGKKDVGRITDAQTHTLFVPYGVYKVLETDKNGRIYDDQNPNPLYAVENPDPVELALENADTALAVIVNKERALGVLSVTKVVNRAPAGTTFYFTVVNSKGERMKMPDENGNPTAEDIWYLTVTDPITSSAVVGTRTLRNIPYDTYTVTETKSDGEPLNKGYAYKVSYETTALGETTKTQTGTITIADPMMSVTVTNTKSSGGGGGGGGKDPGPDPTKPDPTTPDPTNPDPTTPNPGDSSGGDNVPPNIITDGLIPLGGGYYRNPVDGSIIYIGDEGVPLALAKAGDRGSAVEVALLLASVMGIAILLLVRHRKKQSSGD